MVLSTIQKRSGDIVAFDPQKIESVIGKAMLAANEYDAPRAASITKSAGVELDARYGGQTPTVEQIQDVVEETLMRQGLFRVAKSYILYREKRAEARGEKNVQVDVERTITEYLNQLDWRVNANANQGYSLGGMILNTAGKVTANYWLSHIYPKEIGEAHRAADMHIHDLDMFAGYCAGWSLRALLEEGFNGVPDKIESGAPKHLTSAVAQMVNFLGTLQNEWAGAQAFSSFDTYMAPFVKKYALELRKELKENLGKIPVSSPKNNATGRRAWDYRFDEATEEYIAKKVYEHVFQNMQSFVFNLNIPSRWGNQTPFTNITLDWNCPDDLKQKQLILGGIEFDYAFGELEAEMDIVNRAFIEVMTQGDLKGRTFTFPIPTYNIGKDFAWDDPKNLPLFEMTAKYGTPYFQNFINSDMKPGDVRSMCCRLQLDLKELRKRGGGLFGSAEMTGSIGVVTINCARLGYLYKGDMAKFIGNLRYLMQLSRLSLEIKRKEIQKWIDKGLFPFTKRYLGFLRNHFSTIGINGVNEAIRNFTDDKENITTPAGQQMAKDILDFMRETLVQFQEDTGNLYNLEATPAEGTTYRFAKEDQKRFKTILHAGTEEAPYYTNSSQIPVGYTDDVFEALELQDDLQTRYTGGTVLHCYLNERVENAATCRSLVRSILSKFRLPYITITPTFSICPKHGYLTGEYDYCPKCDAALGIDASAPRFNTEYRKTYASTAPEK